MSALLIVELIVVAVLVIVAVVALWRSWAHGEERARHVMRDGEEPTVLSVDLRDRDP